MSTPSFAEAQARLAARRAARDAEAHARLAAQHSTSALRARIAAHPSPLLRRLALSTLSGFDAIASPTGTRPAFRVGQVDAELLDEELLQLLRAQVGDAVKYLPQNWRDDWAAETMLVLRGVLFKLSVWDHDATYGAALQNLKYTDARRGGTVVVPPSRWQKGAYGVVTVLGRYGWTKWEDWLRGRDEGEGNARVKFWEGVTAGVANIHAAASLVSFVVFLVNGRYRTLLDRVLRMRLAPPTSQVAREVSFEYLNRQLVWHAFTEFLLFVLPLVGINRWRRWISRAWRKTKQAVAIGGAEGGEKNGEFAFLPERTCAICYQSQNTGASEAQILAASSAGGVVSAKTDITNPYETIPCGCVYCYVCLTQRIMGEEGEGWTCLRCGEVVKECKPWNGDVLEPQSRSPTTKTVGFAADVKGTPSGDGAEVDSGSDSTVKASSKSLISDSDRGTPQNASTKSLISFAPQPMPTQSQVTTEDSWDRLTTPSQTDGNGSDSETPGAAAGPSRQNVETPASSGVLIDIDDEPGSSGYMAPTPSSSDEGGGERRTP